MRLIYFSFIVVFFCVLSPRGTHAKIFMPAIQKAMLESVVSDPLTIVCIVATAPTIAAPVAIGISVAVIGTHLFKIYSAAEMERAQKQMNDYNKETSYRQQKYNEQVNNHVNGFFNAKEAEMATQKLREKKEIVLMNVNDLTVKIGGQIKSAHENIENLNHHLVREEKETPIEFQEKLDASNNLLYESVRLLQDNDILAEMNSNNINIDEICLDSSSRYNGQLYSDVILDDVQANNWLPNDRLVSYSQPLTELRDSIFAVDNYLHGNYRQKNIPTDLFEAQKVDLEFAKLATYQASRFLEQSDLGQGQEIIRGAHAIVDDMYHYEEIRDQVTAGSHFIAGILQGMTGLPGVPPNRFFRDYWQAGIVVGNAVGLAADMLAITDGMLKITLGGGLGVVSYGSLAPIGAALAAQGALEVSVGTAGFLGHSEAFQKNIMEARSNKQTDGRIPNEPYFKTNKEATEAANKLGFKKTPRHPNSWVEVGSGSCPIL